MSSASDSLRPPKSDFRFDVLFCFDERYLKHAAAALSSTLSYSSKSIVRIHLVLSQKSDRLLRLEEFISSKFGVEVRSYKLTIPPVRAHGHVSNAAYLRLLAPQIVENASDWLLYLDADLVVRSDISGKLAEAARSGKSPIYAVRDSSVPERNYPCELPHGYFNSGVMLANVGYWRSRKLSSKFLEILSSGEIFRYWDQDILNRQLKNVWGELPSSLNIPQNYFPEVDGEIVHFMGPEKPWHAFANRALRDLYVEARDKSPFPWRIPEIRMHLILHFLWRRLKRRLSRLAPD